MTSPLVGLAYLRLRCDDPEACARFALETVGLQRGEADAGQTALRADDFARRLVFAADHDAALALEARDEDALGELYARLIALGVDARWATPAEARARRVHAALLCPDGLEIVTRPERSGRRFFPARDAGVRGLANVGLRSTDIAADLKVWRALGAEPTDYVGEIVYLALDDGHHRVALYPSRARGPLYVAFEVGSLDDVMRGHYFLAERQIKCVQGPGRQTASGQSFVMFRGPEGLIYAYGTDMRRRGPPRQFALSPETLCAWGSRAEGVPELQADGGDER